MGEERKWKSGENKSEREKKKKSEGNKSERKGNICESGESEMKTEKRKRMKEPVSFVPENINLEKKGRGGDK